MKLRIYSQFYYALLVLVSVVLVGTVGFMIVEDYSLNEAFFMTIITISTVGYGEVKPLTDSGRIFTSLLIITSFGTFAYTISAITTYVVGGFYKNYFRQFRLKKEIEKISGHVIVCGLGRVGQMASKALREKGQEFVAIESNETHYERILENEGITALLGDATRDEVLLKAGINRAKALITALPDDADNLYVVLTARELNRSLTIISRASKEDSVRKLKIAGASNVIMPDKVGGAHMASLVVQPDVMEFLDHITVHSSANINLEEVSFADLPEDLRNHTIAEIEEKYSTGVRIIGYKTPTGDYVINPSLSTRLIPNSKLFVLGNKEQIKHLNRILGINIT